MSLINDALKRTRDASYPAAPPVEETYRVGETRPPANPGARPILWITFAVAMIGGVFVTVVMTRAGQDQPLMLPPKPIVTHAQPPVPPPVVAPELPKFVLQGITIDGSEREALINGIGLRVGEELDGARVRSIDAQTVRLQINDRELVLRLP